MQFCALVNNKGCVLLLLQKCANEVDCVWWWMIDEWSDECVLWHVKLIKMSCRLSPCGHCRSLINSILPLCCSFPFSIQQWTSVWSTDADRVPHNKQLICILYRPDTIYGQLSEQYNKKFQPSQHIWDPFDSHLYILLGIYCPRTIYNGRIPNFMQPTLKTITSEMPRQRIGCLIQSNPIFFSKLLKVCYILIYISFDLDLIKSSNNHLLIIWSIRCYPIVIFTHILSTTCDLFC